MIYDREKILSCPNHIAVIGGGRWARVLTGVLCELVPKNVGISVHSPHNNKSMLSWVFDRGLNTRVHCSSEWPRLPFTGSCAVIVVNAARDHERAIEWAIEARVPVLVEKPMVLSASAAERLVDLALKRNVRLATAHVFLFARYLDNFVKLVSDAGQVRSLQVVWTDPHSENRYGETKTFDSSIPVYADHLPHVLSMVGALVSNPLKKCEVLKYLPNSGQMDLIIQFGDTPCEVHLERNSDLRRRVMEAQVGQKKFRLDFSQEPGTITCSSMTRVGDHYWETQARPVARMLTAFLEWAGGGEKDSRLDVAVGVEACRLIDRVTTLTQTMMI